MKSGAVAAITLNDKYNIFAWYHYIVDHLLGANHTASWFSFGWCFCSSINQLQHAPLCSAASHTPL